MALSTTLLSSSSTITMDHSDDHRRRHRHHHSRRKKKPPPPPPSLSPPPGSHSAMAVSRKSPKNYTKPPTTAKNHQYSRKAAAPTSWEQLKGLLSCRSATAAARVHDPAAPSALTRLRSAAAAATGGGPGGACGASLCAVRDVVDAGSSASVDRDTTPLTRSSRRSHRGAAAAAASAGGGGGQPSLRGLSGCYECRAINVEPMSRRYPRPREMCSCEQCGEVFTKAESLENHQAIRHAVSELSPEDSGRNIVEIIFKSSWQKRDRPICQIERILKVHNPQRTIARFEAYRDAVRSRCRAAATARAAADGNELLRFHSATLACTLGLNGSTSLCAESNPNSSSDHPTCAECGVCTTIRHGFAPWIGAHPLGVRTTASSGCAHDCGAMSVQSTSAGCRAMLVCRVIAGRVRRPGDTPEEGPFDSVAGKEVAGGVYGNLEELFVANPRAILPCFVVIYRVVS